MNTMLKLPFCGKYKQLNYSHYICKYKFSLILVLGTKLELVRAYLLCSVLCTSGSSVIWLGSSLMRAVQPHKSLNHRFSPNTDSDITRYVIMTLVPGPGILQVPGMLLGALLQVNMDIKHCLRHQAFSMFGYFPCLTSNMPQIAMPLT